MEKNIFIKLKIYEDKSDDRRINQLSLALVSQLNKLGLNIIQKENNEQIQLPDSSKGDSLTTGVILLSLAISTLPKLISFLENWIGEQRRIKIETAKGLKVEFIPNKKYTEEDIKNFIEKLNQIS